MAYDAVERRLVMVNGWTGTTKIAGTVEYIDGRWTPTSTLPTKRDGAGMAFDVTRRRLVVHGGRGENVQEIFSDTLESGRP
jgi:hypothetical protein